MSLWGTRESALTAAESTLQAESVVIYQGFSLLNEMLVVFQSEDTAFYRITGLTLVKARNIAQGLFSLSLDGLAQEAGALLRPLIECIELLTYLREDPQRVDEVLEERLPSAGEIAKRIQGKLQKLRSYLNKHASHFSFAPESLSHFIDFKSGNWNTTQRFNESVLRQNMTTLFAFQVQLLFVAANCLASNELLTDSLEGRLNEFKEKGYKLFTGVPNEG
ncbi:MAG: hypothetical protein PHY28_03650 [Dehalococcoidales bacterium]|nr:hypothetical protein [Dehalococcoidales bacterium]